MEQLPPEPSYVASNRNANEYGSKYDDRHATALEDDENDFLLPKYEAQPKKRQSERTSIQQAVLRTIAAKASPQTAAVPMAPSKSAALRLATIANVVRAAQTQKREKVDVGTLASYTLRN